MLVLHNENIINIYIFMEIDNFGINIIERCMDIWVRYESYSDTVFALGNNLC
jgi:hypothetical protein